MRIVWSYYNAESKKLKLLIKAFNIKDGPYFMLGKEQLC